MSISSDSSVFEPRVQAGDIFKAPSRQFCATNLEGGAWGHMVLVVGPLPGYRGYWRIMTVGLNRNRLTSSPRLHPQITTKALDLNDYIPFHPAPKGGYPMQLKLGDGEVLPKDPYLRTKERSLWIEDAGLQGKVAWVPHLGTTGMEGLMRFLDAKTKGQDSHERDWDIWAAAPPAYVHEQFEAIKKMSVLTAKAKGLGYVKDYLTEAETIKAKIKGEQAVV
jgi:hypothetical protein